MLLFRQTLVKIAVLGLVLSWFVSAQATTLAPLTLEQLVDASTLIVEGEVQRLWTVQDDRGRIWTKTELSVSETYKGTHQETLIVSTLGGTFQGTTMFVPSTAPFSEGERVVLLLDTIRFGVDYTPVSKFKGKYTVRRAPGERTYYVIQRAAQSDRTYNHRFLPHPKAENRLPYSELISQIEAQIERGWQGDPIPGISLEKLKKINNTETPTQPVSGGDL